MSDLGEILFTLSLETTQILSNTWVDLMTFSIKLALIGVFIFSLKYKILKILRYDFNYGKHILCTSLVFVELWFFMYDSITKRSEGKITLFEITIRS